ncbi:hypothetical protein M3G00_13630 [Brevibacterium casei]|uniref:hypothetical protein n=1 Tax=Brevibacterium casei TaxID=33889 RepID=UPI0012E8D819|nr:hypothetical protein [Brevibacterium casei]MCT2183973.1 hypothetical protein [Brevibacterium casei]
MDEGDIALSWPYSKLVDAPYQYFTGTSDTLGKTMMPLQFSKPINHLDLEFVQWHQRENPGKTPSEIAWIGTTKDGMKLAGWVGLE